MSDYQQEKLKLYREWASIKDGDLLGISFEDWLIRMLLKSRKKLEMTSKAIISGAELIGLIDPPNVEKS